MKQLCTLLLRLATDRQATDIHFELRENTLRIFLRTDAGLEELDQDLFEPCFLDYLQFISGMDLCTPYKPQSGEFSMEIDGQTIECRFSMMNTDSMQTGVIRLLYAAKHFAIADVSHSSSARERLKEMTQIDHGLIISCGPTGSGKSTTVHALLREILQNDSRKIVTLEDPVEIQEPDMIQIQVSPARGITYDTGLSELLRHDLDVLLLGECRTAYCAQMALRASLTGHTVYTTLHCGSGLECLYRLIDLGVDEQELRSILKGIFVCRLIRIGDRKECVYEIWNEEDVARLFEEKDKARPGLSFEACRTEAECSAH